MKFLFIGDQVSALGFRLAGVEFIVAENSVTSLTAFNQATQDTRVAVILITSKVANFIRDKIDLFICSKNFPLICEIPSINDIKKSDYRVFQSYTSRIISTENTD